MNRITNLGGFISLLYIWYNYKNWGITANDINIISQKVVKIISLLPNFIISIFIIILLIILLKGILFNTGGFVINLISRMMLVLILMIGMNMLMLEETTTLYLLKIHHPIGLQYKLQYFESLLIDILESNKSPLCYELNNIQNLEPIQEILKDIKNMNVAQINEATIECVKKLHQVPVDEFPDIKKSSKIALVISIMLVYLYRFIPTT